MSTTTEVGKLAVELAFEAGNAGKQIKAFDKDISNLEKGFKAGAKGVKDYEKTYTGLDAKIQKTSKQLEAYSAKLKLQKEEYTKLESTVTKQKSKLDELESTLGKGSKEWQQQAQLVQKNSEKLNKLGTDIKGTEGNINKLTKELDKAEQEFNQLGNETQSLDDKLSGIDRQTALTESELNKLASTSGKSGEGLKSLGNDMAQVENKLDAGKQKIGAYDSEIKKLSTELESNKSSHKDLGTEINKTESELSKAKKQYGENSTEAQQLKAKLLGLKDEYNSLEKEINEGEQELQEYQTALNNTEAEVNSLSRELAQMPFERAGQAMQDAGQKITGVGKTLTAGITMPLVGIGTASSLASMDFGTAMAKVSTIADDTEVSFDDMKKAILGLSNQTGISASAIADDVYNAISAGQKTGDAVNFVTESTKLAKAGFAESGQALDVLTTILNAYGKEADQVGKVSDVLIQIQNKGKTTVGDLSATMGKIIPTANSMGVSLEQLGAGYALMTSKGIATAETTTYMNSLLNELGKSGTKASEALKKGTGKTFQQLTKDGVPLGQVLTMLDKEAKKNKKSLADMFGSAEAGKAALVLATDSGKAFDGALKDMYDSAEGTNTAFEKVNDTTGNRLAISLNELKNAGIKLGDSLAPIVEALSKAISTLAGWFDGLDESSQSVVIGFGIFAAAVGPILIGVGQLVFFGGQAITMLGGLAGGATTATGATTGLTGAIGLLTGPVGLIALGVALVGAMAYIGDSESAILSLQDKFGGLGFVIGAVCEFISGIVQLTFGNIIITIMGVCDIIAAIMDGPGGATVKDAWGRMNANLEMNTNEAMGKMLLTTSRGMSQMGAMSEFELTNMVTAMDGIMGQIPLIVDGKYSEASQGIVKHLNAMDHNQLLALQGMNDTTKAIFTNIRADMTIAEKTNEVAFNIKRMQQSGKFDAQTMQKDLSGAFDTIKSRITTTTKEAANAANTNTKGMGTNVAANAKQTEQQVAAAMSGTKTQIDTNTKGASQVADKNTKDLSSKVDANTKDVKQKVDKNTKDMATSTKTNAETMKNSAVSSAQQMQRQVVTATQAMANSAISNWNSIRNAYSRGITGNVAINRTISTVNRAATLNTEGVAPINFTVPKINIAQYRTRANEILPKQFSNLKFAQFNIDKQLKNLESKLLNGNGDIKLELNFEKIEIHNNDDYKIAAKKLVNEMLIEMEKQKIKNKKFKGK